MKKMIVTFENGQVVEVPMESRRNFNKTKEAIEKGQELIDLNDHMFKIDQIQCVSWSEDK